MDSYDKLRAAYERLRALNEQHCVEAWKKANGYDDLLAAYSRATDALNFLRRVAEGGYIVSSAALTPEQIAYARAGDRMFVTDDGLGYVYNTPGDHRELVESLRAERDAALAQLRDSDRMCRDTNAINASLTSALVGALKEWGVHVKMLDAVRGLIESNGCDCDCGCDSEGHADSCEPCLACRVSAEVSR